MSTLRLLWDRLSNIGQRPHLPDYLSLKIRLANGLILLLLLPALAVQLKFGGFHITGAAGGLLLAPLGLYFLHRGYHTLVRVVLSIVPMLFAMYSTVEVTPYPSPVVPAQILFLGMMVLPLVLFDPRERKPMFATLAVLIVAFLAYDPLNAWLVTDPALEATPEFIQSWPVRYLMYTLAIFVLVAALGYLVRMTHQANQRVGELVYELQAANEELRVTLDVIEAQQRNIIDSITYASRIQRAILPDQQVLAQFPVEHFILYRPRDVVSGDFYWMAEADGKLLVAAVDCTGHGVPGAFMSVLGNSLLNQLVNVEGMTEPALILDRLHQGVMAQLLSSRTDGNEVLDGMEVAIVCLDFQAQVVHFAGANRPLYVLQPVLAGAAQARADVTETAGTKRPIGGKYHHDLPFQTQTLPLVPGLTLYLTSDGFADQNGGTEGRKLGSKRLKELFADGANLAMPEQHQRIERALDAWKGNYSQRDDILVVGLRVQA